MSSAGEAQVHRLQTEPAFAQMREQVGRLFYEAGLQVDVDHELGLSQARIFFVQAGAELLCALLYWRVGDEVEILDIASAKGAQRRGHARRLLETTLAQEAAAGAERAFLEVRVSNVAARSLYESLDFERGQVRRAYYRDGEDAQLYHRELHER